MSKSAPSAPTGGPRAGGDLCPGALRLHDAADGSLARLRIPGGLLTSAQATALADAADDDADGRIHLTARGNVELRAVRDADALAARLTAARLLPTRVDRDRVRNLVATPLAGLDGAGVAEAQTWVALVRRVEREFVTADGLDELSGRFLVGLDDGRGDVAALRPDLLAILRPHGRILLGLDPTGAGSAAVELDAADAPRALAAAAATFVAAARTPERTPGAWRIREVGVAARTAVLDALAARPGAVRVPAPVLPRAVEVAPGRFRGPLGAGLITALPLGEADAAAWRLLTTIAAAGDGLLRTTPQRAVVLAGLTPARADEAARELATAGLVVTSDDPRAGVSACIGTGCARALLDIREVARAGFDARARAEQRPRVHFSACERRCGHPVGAHDEVVASPEGLLVGRRHPDDPIGERR